MGVPLSYDALKTVLQFMDANKRFEISRRIPSIRTADRVTPLFIAKLSFDGHYITINHVKYTLTVCATNQLYWRPSYQKHFLKLGRHAYDLDQYGLEDSTTEAVVTPGDLVNEERAAVPTEDDVRGAREAMTLHLEEHLEVERDEQRRYTEDEAMFEYHRRKIEELEAKLIPYHCYRENRPLSYELDPFILFYQETSTGVMKKERVSYNRKLPEAMKYLTTKLFGNRRHPIKVRRLVNSQNYKTIRLPANLKMEVTELDVMKMSEARHVLPVILDSKVHIFRLDSPREPDFEMEILKTARSLIIHCREFLDWLPRAQNLQNQKVLLMGTDFDNFPNNYILLMKHWIENGKELGSCFSFGLTRNAAVKVLSVAKEQFGSLEIKMKNECRLLVSMEETYFEEEEGFFSRSWRVNMEVADKYIDCF